jgi:hypothetical protein
MGPRGKEGTDKILQVLSTPEGLARSISEIGNTSNFFWEIILMRFGKTIGMAGFIGFLGAGAAFAQTNDPGIRQKMENQQKRIDQGVASGALTPREAGKLEAEQARIKQTEGRMNADGNLTSKERQKLNNMQDNASNKIYRQKYDRQKAPVR